MLIIFPTLFENLLHLYDQEMSVKITLYLSSLQIMIITIITEINQNKIFQIFLILFF